MGEEPLSQEEIDKLLQAVIAKESIKAEAVQEPFATKGAERSRETGDSSSSGPQAKNRSGAQNPPATSDALRKKWAAYGELQLRFTAEIGMASLKLGDVLQVGVGSRLPVKARWMEPLVLRLNGKTVGYGRVVLVGNKFGVEVTRWGRIG